MKIPSEGYDKKQLIDYVLVAVLLLLLIPFFANTNLKTAFATTYWGASNPWYTGGGYVAREWPPGSNYRGLGKTWGSINGGGNAPVTIQVIAYQVDQNGTCQMTPWATKSGWGDTGVQYTQTKSVLPCGGGYHYYYAQSVHIVGYSGSNQLTGSRLEY